MTVEIPISANPSSVIAGLRELTGAIARAKGEAAEFAAIDLSHGELGNLANEMKSVLKNFEDLARIGRGSTAAGVRAAIGAQGFTPAGLAGGTDHDRLSAFNAWADTVAKQFPDPADRARHVRNTLGYVTAGTGFQSSDADAPESPAIPGGGSVPARRSEGFFKRHGRAAGGFLGSFMGGEAGAAMGGGMGAGLGAMFPELAAPLLALAGIQGAGKMVGAAYHDAVGEDKSDDSFLRTIQGSASDFGALRDAARQAAAGLMLTYQQSATLGANFARIANISDPRAALAGMRSAVGFANAYGLDQGSTSSAFASASLLGMDPERFGTLIAEATAKGNDKSQTPQVMQAILSFAQNASRYLVMSGAINGATGNYAAMFASMQATGNPGMMGDAGAALLSSINSSIMSGGSAGMAGQVFTYQALARAGIRNPYAVQYAESGGAFTPMTDGHGRKTDMYNIMQQEFNRQYGAGDSYMKDYAESQYYGINMRQAAALAGLKPAELDFATSYLSKIGVNSNQINMSALPGIVGLLNDPNSSKMSPAALQSQVLALNKGGLPQTDSSKNTLAMDNLTNALTGAGTGLVPAVTVLSGGMASLLTPLTAISIALDKLLGITPKSIIFPVKPGGGGGLQFIPPSNPNGKTRPDRDNNPLNVGYGGGAFGAEGEDYGGEGIYSSRAAGLAGAVALIRSYQARGITKLGATDYRWTPTTAERTTLDQIEADSKGVLTDSSDLTNPKNLALYLRLKAKYEGSPVTAAQVSDAMQVQHSPIVIKLVHPDGQVQKALVPNTTAVKATPHNAPHAQGPR